MGLVMLSLNGKLIDLRERCQLFKHEVAKWPSGPLLFLSIEIMGKIACY